MAPDEATTAGAPGGLGLALDLVATKAPALHDTDGWIDFGPAGGSYYYSRTAMAADGTVTLDGQALEVDRRGLVRPSVGRLHQRRRRRLGLVRRQPRRRHGPDPVVGPRRRRHVPVRSTARSWRPMAARATSDATPSRSRSTTAGRARRPAPTIPPAGRSRIPGQDLAITLTPTVADQELDTRATTGVVYWEGSQRVDGHARGAALGGEAYVELTGYAPSGIAGP